MIGASFHVRVKMPPDTRWIFGGHWKVGALPFSRTAFGQCPTNERELQWERKLRKRGREIMVGRVPWAIRAWVPLQVSCVGNFLGNSWRYIGDANHWSRILVGAQISEKCPWDNAIISVIWRIEATLTKPIIYLFDFLEHCDYDSYPYKIFWGYLKISRWCCVIASHDGKGCHGLI